MLQQSSGALNANTDQKPKFDSRRTGFEQYNGV